MNRKQKKSLIRILITVFMLLVLNLLPLAGIELTGIWRLTLFALTYLVIGYDILRKAGLGIIHGRVFDENFLMSAATLGAFALALIQKSGDYNEAIAVMLFYQIGELFQSYAVGKSRRSISGLMDIRPDYANVEQDGQIVRTEPYDVPVGSRIIVQPGEKIPIDGIVEEGESSIDTSSLTGESVPRSVAAGEEVISGCINLSGVLKIRTNREFGESTVSKILNLIEESGTHKSKQERFISRFARIYTPVVCISALLLAVVPPLIRMGIAGMEPMWQEWIYRALTFLVISCPCALVISIPLSFFAGIGGAGRSGILIKGSDYLEAMARIRTMVFDKTGTLTKGVFEVSAIHHNRMEESRLIEYAALAECSSSHPVSISLRKAYGREIDRSRVCDIREISGEGVMAVIDGMEVAAGNGKLMRRIGIEPQECHSPGTIIHMAIDHSYAGHIVIMDEVKLEASRAIRGLKENGVTRTVMLTGDVEKAAIRVAKELDIDEVCSGLLPADKVTKVEELIGEKASAKEIVAFAGDGMNDAPVLMRADIGIAMGAMGSDAAIEAADIVLMDDDPEKIVKAIRISRKCLRIVYQNIVFSLVVKFLCLLLGAMGIANMWYAIFADVGVMILAVLNAIRALRVSREKERQGDGSGKISRAGSR